MQKPLFIKLTNLILVVLLFSLAVSALILFYQKSYLAGFIMLLGAGFLALTLRWSDFAKVALILVCLFIYLTAYLTNVVLIFLEPQFTNSYVQRLHAARKLKVPYDTRTPLQVVAPMP